MFSTTIAAMEKDAPDPPRVAALAVLEAYKETAVPLSYQTAAEWYGTGGRYWRTVWLVCGYKTRGDKFYGADSIAWAQPLDPSTAAGFWDTMTALASASDEWQLAQGIDAPPPTVNVNALVHRTSSWREMLTQRWSLWSGPPTSAHRLVAVLKNAAKQLDEWYRRRFPGRPPLPPPLPSTGGLGTFVLVVGGLLLLGGGRRRRR